MEMDINIDSYDWGNINSPWIGAEPHIWDSLTQGRPILQYPAKSVIFSQGDAYRDAFIIMSGRVRHSVFSKVGLEKQVYIACPGAMIGEISCILSKPHSMTATAIVPTGLVKIPSKELQRLFHSSPMLADLMLQYEARKAQMMAVQQASLSFDTAETRIAKHLLCLCDTYGVVRPDGIRIGIRFTCSDIAGIVGTSRVTANNTLLDFQKLGILKKEGGSYCVTDIQRLIDMTEETIEF